MPRHLTIYSVLVIASVTAVIFLVDYHGRMSRFFAEARIIETVDSPEKALSLWQKKMVRGRILLLFDDYPHARGLVNYHGDVQLTESNLVEFSIFENIIRKVYLVVRDDEWPEFIRRKEVRPLRETMAGQVSFLYYRSGVPVVAVAQAALRQLPEPALVYQDEANFPKAEVLDLLRQKQIDYDIFITCRGPGS